MPTCPVHNRPCRQEISAEEEFTQPSCTPILVGSVVTACAVHHAAEWIMRHWPRGHRGSPPSQDEPRCEETVSRRVTSGGLKQRLQCPRRRSASAIQSNTRSPRGLRPAKWVAKCFRRKASCFLCCDCGNSRRSEVQGDPAMSDVTIIPFESEISDDRMARPSSRGRDAGAMPDLGASRESVVDENWDEAVDLTLRRVVYSTAGGAIAALTLFRSPATRWSAIAFGAGVGLGSTIRDSSYILNGSDSAWPFN